MADWAPGTINQGQTTIPFGSRNQVIPKSVALIRGEEIVYSLMKVRVLIEITSTVRNNTKVATSYGKKMVNNKAYIKGFITNNPV